MSDPMHFLRARKGNPLAVSPAPQCPAGARAAGARSGGAQ
jgi:hypothetical protein